MKARLAQTNFIAGQFDEVARARTDTAMLRNGAAELRNCLPLATGGVLSRWGTRHLRFLGDTAVGGNPPVRLVPFEFSRDQGYVLALMPGRMWVLDGATGDSLQLVTGCPWAAADLPLIRFAQLGDVLWITAPGFDFHEIVRQGYASFVVRPVAFDTVGGRPFFRFAHPSVEVVAGQGAVETITLTALPSHGGGPRRPEVGITGRAASIPGGAWNSFTVTSVSGDGLTIGVSWLDPGPHIPPAGINLDVQFAFPGPNPNPPPPNTGGGAGDGGGVAEGGS